MGAQTCRPCCKALNNSFREQYYQGTKQKQLKPIEFSEKSQKYETNQEVEIQILKEGNQAQIESSNTKQISTFAWNQQQTVLPLNSRFKQDNEQLQKDRKSDNDQLIYVPFDVIKLLITKQMLFQIKRNQIEFEKNYSDPNCHSYRTWRMQKEGYYTNNLIGGKLAILTGKYFYEGWTQIGGLVPEGFGIMISNQGTYRGNFHEGLANGKGKYINLTSNNKIDGKWQKGKLKEGVYSYEKIKNQEKSNSKKKMRNYEEGINQYQGFEYEGTFRNSVPHGSGILIVYNSKKNQRFRYIGNFVNGKFEGEGKYESQKFTYFGSFQGGRRNGEGVLVLRQEGKYKGKEKGKGKKKSGMSGLYQGERIEGVWKNDRIVQ